MRKILRFVLAFLVSFLTACTARYNQSWQHSYSGKRHYHIEQYSGGKLIGQYNFYGILNNEDSSDGFYWFSNDSLYEVSGDLIIEAK